MRTFIVTVAAVCSTLLSAAAVAGTDPVLEWNAIMVSATAGQNPFAQARYAAITQLAVFEAVNAIDKRYQPYLGTVTAPAGASREAAAVTAAYAVLSNYFPTNTTLSGDYATSLAAIPDGQAKSDGIAVGQQSATAFITLRAMDGSSPPQFYKPTSTAAGEWQPTPSCPAAGGILEQWGNLRPFAIESTNQFLSAPEPALTSLEYALSYYEVMLVGSVNSAYRPQDRSDVARFYAATTPVPVWNSALQQVAVELGRSMSQNARALALVNVAISDAAASVFDTKYSYYLWRPETAIHASGNTSWQPYIVTPCFPGYGSAHGSLSNAARKVLEHLYGPDQHAITLTNAAVTGVTLQYTTFEQITHDISDARVYGGIHFRFDQDIGAEQGRKVGAYVFWHVLRPVDDGDDQGGRADE